jgi:flavin reductase (DIM6/NTAB) family NADH-FMN oxidoreductase RutF
MVIEAVLAGSKPRPRLRDEDDFQRFNVVAKAPVPDVDALRHALAGLAVVVDDEHVLVRPEAVSGLAGPQPDAWRRSFAAMVQAAQAHGWIDETGSIRAHVDWEELDGSHIDATAYRHVLGHFPTGIAIITANSEQGPVGMACNSLTSVSLDPPLIAVCPARTSETWPRIRRAGHFLVNIMASHQEQTTRRFARKGTDRFESIAARHDSRAIALDDALAWIDCRFEAEHEAGDHTIAVCRVLHLEACGDQSPLVFYKGDYGTFTPATEAPSRPPVPHTTAQRTRLAAPW